jgi:hypothetical protein
MESLNKVRDLCPFSKEDLHVFVHSTLFPTVSLNRVAYLKNLVAQDPDLSLGLAFYHSEGETGRE